MLTIAVVVVGVVVLGVWFVAFELMLRLLEPLAAVDEWPLPARGRTGPARRR
jgi:hypothetical protein